MSRWRSGDLIAVAAGAVVAMGSLLPWASLVRSRTADGAVTAATYADSISAWHLVAMLMGAIMIAAGSLRSGWTAGSVMAAASGSVVAVLGSRVASLGSSSPIGFGVYVVLTGTGLAITSAVLNSMEYETRTDL
ncbi:MAG TPA: hypothetical protein VLA05_08105, partial [Coriobacteriia bacterium]|nr:hypothetical protein [Coriobacteriia bacterium]